MIPDFLEIRGEVKKMPKTIWILKTEFKNKTWFWTGRQFSEEYPDAHQYQKRETVDREINRIEERFDVNCQIEEIEK